MLEDSDLAPDRPRGLDAFFAPRGVCVVGASSKPGKVGHAVVRNLLYGGSGEDRARGFQGAIVPVNPRADEVLGLRTAKRIEDLPPSIDLAVFAIPAPDVPAALDAVARRGVRAAIVLSAGFFEMGAEGRRLEAQLRSVAHNTGLRLIGPNCTGIYSARSNLQASFFSLPPHQGPTALISQSGAIAQALVQQSHMEELGLRHVVSLGDKADVEDAELVRYFARDPETRVIALYVESLDDARGFHAAARKAARKKAVVVLHGGRTGPGHRAARLHEGILAMSDSATRSALAHPAVQLTPTLGAFLAAIRALALQRPAPGRSVAIVTNAGGAGVLAADAITAAGLDVVKLQQATVSQLRRVLANPRACMNPIDLLGDARADRFLAALEITSTAAEVDAILLVLSDQAMTDPMEVARTVCGYAPHIRKPIVACFLGQVVQQSQRLLERHGIPEYELPELAVEGLRALVARGEYLRRLERRDQTGPARRRQTTTTTTTRPWSRPDSVRPETRSDTGRAADTRSDVGRPPGGS